MVEKRRPAGDDVTAASLNESTDLDSLLSAILGDRAGDTLHNEPPRLANVATFRFAGFKILTEHDPAAPEDKDGLAGQTPRLALLDDPDRPNVRTMERPAAEDGSQPIQEASRDHIYRRGGMRHARSRAWLPLIGAVSVLIVIGVLGLPRINAPVPAADSTGAGTTAVPAAPAVTVPPPSPPTEVVATPAIAAPALAATTAVQLPPKAPRRVDNSPAPWEVRPDAFASRSTPPPATSTEGLTAEPPTPVASSLAATTAPPASDAPTPQPAATRETAPDSATVRVENPPSPAAGGSAAAAPAAVPANRRTQPRLMTGGAPDYPRQLRSAKIGGTVEVTVTIDAAGRVTSAQSLSGPPLLRAAAEAAVIRWRYQPALLNGVAVQTETSVRFVFDPQSRPREEN